MNSKRKEVIERLIEQIHTGGIVHNDKLPSERDLANILGEHRTVVREALISLEAMGVIDIRERQGIYLSSAEENEAKVILARVGEWPADKLSRALEMRQILEPATAALAAARRTDTHIEKLSHCLENMRNVLGADDPGSAKAGIYWNTIFHSIIASATNNSYMARIYENILASIEHGMFLMRYGTPPSELGGRHVAFRDHEDLLSAIRDMDVEKAERISERHLSHTVKAMVSLGQIMQVSNLYNQKFAGRIRFDDERTVSAKK